MSKRAADWQQYLLAAGRKLEIAAYHMDQLEHELTSSNDAGPDLMPPISVQAHFEGVVVPLMAAVDQVAEAVNSRLGLRLPVRERRDGAYKEIAAAVPEVDAWYQDPLGQDLRNVRVWMVHRAYKKTRTQKEVGWFVEQPARSKYSGSRELAAYAKAAIQYAKRLSHLIPKIQDYLSRSETRRA